MKTIYVTLSSQQSVNTLLTPSSSFATLQQHALPNECGFFPSACSTVAARAVHGRACCYSRRLESTSRPLPGGRRLDGATRPERPVGGGGGEVTAARDSRDTQTPNQMPPDIQQVTARRGHVILSEKTATYGVRRRQQSQVNELFSSVNRRPLETPTRKHVYTPHLGTKAQRSQYTYEYAQSHIYGHSIIYDHSTTYDHRQTDLPVEWSAGRERRPYPGAGRPGRPGTAPAPCHSPPEHRHRPHRQLPAEQNTQSG